jgi:fructokinase
MTSAQSGDKPILLGVGELLWDIFPDGRRPGGAPANVAYHARQLGLAGDVCTRVGDDLLGRELLAYLRDNGLTGEFVQVDPEKPTGTVEVHHSATGPSYTIHEDVAWDYLAPTDAILQRAEQAAAISFGTLAQRCEPSRSTIREIAAAAQRAWRIYDINLRPPFFDRAWIDASLKLCNVAKFNHDEAPQLADLLDLSGPRSLDAIAAALRSDFGLDLVAITLGKDGCLLVGEETMRDAGSSVTVADTVGAGDSFTAGLAYGLVHGWALSQIAALANRVAGLVASRPGAMPDLRAAYADLITTLRSG